MSMYHFCTYFDHGYLPKGIIMLTSLIEHCPNAFVHVLCLNDVCFATMREINLPGVILYSLPELEKADPELAACKRERNIVEYYWTMSPCLPTYIFSRHPGLDRLTYIDADLFFMSDPTVIFAEKPDASVIITPHRFPEHMKAQEAYGVYNVSWLTFANTEHGCACLAWYREKCIEWCFYKLEVNRCGDQKYLDYFAEIVPGVHVIDHIGAGLAPWNAVQYHFAADEHGVVSVDGLPVVFYHAHGFWQVCLNLYDPGIAQYTGTVPPAFRKHVLIPYANRLHAAGNRFGGDMKGILRRGKEAKKMPSLKQFLFRTIRKEYIIASGDGLSAV